MSRSRRSKRWCFTINNPTEDEVRHIKDTAGSFSYIIFGRETGESGTPHLQGYLELSGKRTLSGVKRLLGTQRAHLEIAQGTPKEAAEYCKKERNYEEFGEISAGRGKRTDLIEIQESIKEGKGPLEIADAYFSQWVVYRRSFAEYRRLLVPTVRRVDLKVFVLVGRTGVGKTRFVHDFAGSEALWISPDHECKWFDGYSGQPHALFDDFRGKAPFEFLLRLLDVYPLDVPVKGSFVTWRPETIWLTSNWNLQEWYPDAEISPLIRRVSRVITIGPELQDYEEIKDFIKSQME